MNDVITSTVEGVVRGILSPLVQIFDDFHFSDEESAKIDLKFKQIENSFILEMRAIDHLVESMANNSISQTNILISYAHDHPENKALRALLGNRQRLLDTLEEYENESKK
jgi:hypothetical protein